MSTARIDRIASSIMPLPQVDGIGDLQTFIALSGQTTFNLTQFDGTSQVRVFVEGDEATFTWSSLTSINISAPAISAGSKIRVYKVLGELAYKDYQNIADLVSKDYQNIADLVSDEALINSIIFS